MTYNVFGGTLNLAHVILLNQSHLDWDLVIFEAFLNIAR